MYYVYEMINLLGGVEHVGKTIRPEIRFYEHVKNKPNKGKGKFYKRQDISMHIVATYATKAEALQAEYDLQIFWGLTTDNDLKKISRSPESIIKQTLAQKGKKRKPFTEEHKKNISEAIKNNLHRF